MGLDDVKAVVENAGKRNSRLALGLSDYLDDFSELTNTHTWKDFYDKKGMITNMNEIDFNNRKFKFWYYHITHKEALFRSEKDKYFDNNIDIYFGAIEYMEIPTDVLSGLQLAKAKDKDVLYLSKKIGKEVLSDNIAVLISGKQRFYIVASVVKIMENTLERMELPFYTFMKCAENEIM